MLVGFADLRSQFAPRRGVALDEIVIGGRKGFRVGERWNRYVTESWLENNLFN